MAAPSNAENNGGTNEYVPSLVGGNWHHYTDATRVFYEFLDRYGDQSVSSDTGPTSVQSAQPGDLRPVAENTLMPLNDYLCFYCDLLGFSQEMRTLGMDSLPDYYGAAYVAAGEHPSTKVYLLSDSFIAFAPMEAAAEFIGLIQSVIGNWKADGLLPQCSIGYGTFVERKPIFGRIPDNFFGVQIAGTALVEAADLHKAKPMGARMLVSPSAVDELKQLPDITLVSDLEDNFEMFLKRNPRSDLFDCLYYLMCLRDWEPSSRVYDHYIWSIASRAFSGGVLLTRGALNLCIPLCDETQLRTAAERIQTVLDGYRTLA